MVYTSWPLVEEQSRLYFTISFTDRSDQNYPTNIVEASVSYHDN